MEFAFAIPIVLFLMFATLEFGRHFYVRLTLQHAVSEAARFAITGNVLADTSGTALTRAQSIAAVISRSASTLNVDLDRVTIDPPDGGGPSDIVTISADFTFQFLAPWIWQMFDSGEIDFTLRTALKNEPFIL